MTNPLTVCAVVFLALATLSVWVFKKPYCFFLFLIGACFFTLLAHALPLSGLISFAILALLHFFIPKQSPVLVRASLFTLAALLSFGLILHIVPGAPLLHIIKGASVSSNSPTFDLNLSMNEAFVGMIPLALSVPLIRSRFQCQFVWKKTALFTALLLLTFFAVGGLTHLLSFEPKVPFFSLSFLFSNLFLSVIPQEAFFRGFLQRQFSLFFSHNGYKWVSVAFSAVLFALMQLAFHVQFPFILLSFLASLILGVLYHLTESIESVITAHFIMSLTHFFFFTYPYMAQIA